MYFELNIQILNKDTYIFIINPIAGSKRTDLNSEIKNFAEKNQLDFIIENTLHKGNGTEIVSRYLLNGYEKFIAVGGDGTVNEIACKLIGTSGALGIIPAGSGNGLARSLGIPMNLHKALNSLIKSPLRKIDVGSINKKPFFCTAGIGFDAHCAHEFANGTHARGLWNYVKIFFKNYFTYPIQNGLFEGQKVAFYTITFANAPQYGNNAYIAPKAVFDDKLLDCTIVKPHPKIYGFILGYKLFAKKIQNSTYISCLQADNYKIDFDKPALIHIDGEAETECSSSYEIQVLPHALNIFYP